MSYEGVWGRDVPVEKMGTSRDPKIEHGWLSGDQEGASVPRGQVAHEVTESLWWLGPAGPGRTWRTTGAG